MAMLDELHDPLPAPEYDRNIYTLGSIGKYNVVITCPPMGIAAKHIYLMANIFREIKFSLLVGVGSGVPPNVRLGDVVVGTLDQIPVIDTGAETPVHIKTLGLFLHSSSSRLSIK